MINKTQFISLLFIFFWFILLKDAKGNLKKDDHLLKIWCTSPDSAGTINGRKDVCFGDTATYSVAAISLATGYNWTLPSGATILSGTNTNSIKVIFKGSGGNITVYGTNTCLPGKASNIFVTVNSLPKLTLIAPQKYCCDYGNISLSSSNFATPVGGSWSCRQNYSFINSNSFLTSQACNPAKPGIFSLLYTYQDPTTGCINRDSTKFTINPLPAIKFVGGTICQSTEKIRLKPYIKAPINLNAMMEVQLRLFKTLPKIGGGFCTKYDLITDEDFSLNYDYWLTVSKKVIDLGAKIKDSIILEITIQDGNGCYNKDTASFMLINDPVITFDGFPELCINTGKVNLTKISNTKPENGCWNVINTVGFSPKTNIMPGIIGCDSLNTLKLNFQNSPGLYWMSYVHTASGCPVNRDTLLRINPLPTVTIGLNPNSDKGIFCQTEGDISLLASPVGGVWTSSVPGVIAGNKFKPSFVTGSDRDKWIILTYVYMNPNTKCDTAKSLMVFVQSKPIVDIITPDMDTCWRKLTKLKFTAKHYFTSKITWYHNHNPATASFENNQQFSNNNPAIYTISAPKDSTTFVLITATTENEGVCPFSFDTLWVKINPVACKDSIPGTVHLHANNPFDVAVFPNPIIGNFNIEIKKAGKFTFKLFAIDGKQIYEKNIAGLETEFINLKLSKGFYIINIEDEAGYLVRKRVIVD